MNQLFRIGHDAWAALSPEEVAKTVEGLCKMGLFRLPYEKVDMEFQAVNDIIRWKDPKSGLLSNSGEFKDGKYIGERPLCVLYKGIRLVPTADKEHFDVGVEQVQLTTPGYSNVDMTEYVDGEALIIVVSGFICLLATKNVLKTTKEDKLAKLGIGRKKSHRYRYVTTISLPKNMADDEEHTPSGGVRRPHWRRGHVRNQHYGPGLEFIKLIWIEPVFVNADPDFVDKREAYNVSTGKKNVNHRPSSVS